MWKTINRGSNITISLLKAENQVDTGCIWKKVKAYIPKISFLNEFNKLIFNAELKLMELTIKKNYSASHKKHPDVEATYWPKRSPKDNEIDISKTISEEFELIRVCDT